MNITCINSQASYLSTNDVNKNHDKSKLDYERALNEWVDSQDGMTKQAGKVKKGLLKHKGDKLDLSEILDGAKAFFTSSPPLPDNIKILCAKNIGNFGDLSQYIFPDFIEDLDLTNCGIIKLPKKFPQSIKKLVLDENPISGLDLSSFPESIERIQLELCHLTQDKIKGELKNPTNIKEINLSSNHFAKLDSLYSILKKLPKNAKLNMCENPISITEFDEINKELMCILRFNRLPGQEALDPIIHKKLY